MKFEIPKNYVISYNPEKNYNEVDSTYLPPYRSNSHPSIYEGVTVEMHIVNHCNINCNCCNHFSPLADPWFITVDFFKEQVQLLKDNVSSLKEFLILGGEPLLHPDILTLCKIARTILGPNIIINVLTNGTLVNKIKEEEQQYSEMEIKFIFTSYKNYSDKMMKDISIGEIHYTRTLSKQTLVECSGSLNGFNNFFNCTNHQLPCLTLKNSKLYICPFCAHIDSFCKKNNIVITEKEWVDFIPLDKLNNELDKLQTFCFTPKNYCNYCVQNTEAVPFTKSKKDIIEFTIPLYELYFRDYERYEQVINANNGHIEWCLSEDNLGKIDYRFHTHTLETEILRYKNAKIDLIIPYFNETKDQLIALYENLKMQTAINNCMIYLISDGSNMDRFVLNLFKDLHCVFLRNKIQKGPGAARNKGIVNSFSQHILFMDADDLFINNQALEKLIEATQNVQLLSFLSIEKIHPEEQKRNFVIHRNIINNNHLQFKEIYFAEDLEFEIHLLANIDADNYKIIENDKNIFLEYNATQGINITKTFFFYDKLQFSYLSANIIGIYETLQKNPDNILVQNYIEDFLARLNKSKNICHDHIFVQQLLDLLFAIIYPNKSYNVNKQFLISYISEHYLHSNKMSENARLMLNILQSME